MANVSLDNQIFFTLPPRNRNPSVSSFGGPKAPEQDTHDPRRGTAGASRDDAVLISSDDESDYGELDDGQSDTSFPPIEELLPARRKDVESGSVADADKSFNATSGAGGDSDAIEPSITEEADPDDEIASSQQQQARGLRRSPAPPSIQALPRPSSASPGPLQAEQEQPIPAGSASCEAGQISAPENTTCGKPAEEISRASPPGVEAQHMPSPGCLSRSSLPRPGEATDRESTPRCDSGDGDSDSDDEARLRLAEPKSGRRTVFRHGVRRSLRNSRVGPNHKDEAVRQSDGQDSPRRHLGRRRRNNMEDEDIYHPLEASEREQDEEDNDDIRPPKPKRRKVSSPTRSTLRTSIGRRTRSDGATSRSRQIQTSVPGRKRSGRRSIPSPPSSQVSHDKEEAAEAVFAKFEERPIENGSLKSFTVNGVTTFQLQWSVGPCTKHRHRDHATGSQQYKPPAKKSLSTKRGAATRIAFTPEEDDLLIELNSQELPWKKIHMQFREAFPEPERSVAALQSSASELYNWILLATRREAASPGVCQPKSPPWPPYVTTIVSSAALQDEARDLWPGASYAPAAD
ncbi:hypothetical protein QBC46DRAFT_454591 [Diplogelasinospora grovesii]|uniref:Myb-like domain-containing protein n=1 Tax=Diplogelasinospora grovesii TaxID=303347 RepID=A0AAN6RYT9_9PEZI|nr:hypothetical protein QBC46DRAFT_454591 [Diplogelasinospora grovesii]